MSVSYEHPLNERVRTLMRLDDLFARVYFFATQENFLDHHAALLALFEIIEVAARADLKSDLLQELERQKLVLSGLRHHQSIDQELLDNLLDDIDRVIAKIFAFTGKVGMHLRENEWLMAIKQRASLPGGICGFDLPAFHFWRHQPPVRRQNDLQQWLAPLEPIRNGISIILRILRESSHTTTCTAQHGVFQMMQANTKAVQLLRLTIADGVACVPEISANKYALNIRFLTAEEMTRGGVCDYDITFDLTLCSL
ncbi:MAG: cell division protein ZapD [Burkholderiales bacterium]|jgi:cell division protein ZapD|nr:cell division protein ZapD [Burkholderiales bacterium]